MKIKTLAFATAVMAFATGGAFAQTSSGMSGGGMSGGGMSGGGMSGGGTGSTMSQPEAGSNKGAPTSSDAKKTEMEKNKSPGSTNSGTAQEK